MKIKPIGAKPNANIVINTEITDEKISPKVSNSIDLML
jgi:hypothetical protein